MVAIWTTQMNLENMVHQSKAGTQQIQQGACRASPFKGPKSNSRLILATHSPILEKKKNDCAQRTAHLLSMACGNLKHPSSSDLE